MFETMVVVGNNLVAETKKVASMRHRQVFKDISAFLERDGREVGIIYGIRRTGKTTLLLQAAKYRLSAGKVKETALILLSSSNTMSHVLRDLQRLREEGFKYFLLDEVTELFDFTDSCALLSDYFSGNGARVLLSGTNSLTFNLIYKQELYDRCVLFDISFISFQEYTMLHVGVEIDDFLRRCGVASPIEKSPFASEATTLRYVDTAIAKNIHYSLARYRGGESLSALRELYANDMLIWAINRIVQLKDHPFSLNYYLQKFKSDAYGNARDMLKKQDTRECLTPLDLLIDKHKVDEEHALFLGYKDDSGLAVRITQRQLDVLRKHLLDLGVAIECVNFYDGFKSPPLASVVFVQPGLRYSVANVVQHAFNVHSSLAKMDLSRIVTVTSKWRKMYLVDF